jgi:hypothetical protein
MPKEPPIAPPWCLSWSTEAAAVILGIPEKRLVEIFGREEISETEVQSVVLAGLSPLVSPEWLETWRQQRGIANVPKILFNVENLATLFGDNRRFFDRQIYAGRLAADYQTLSGKALFLPSTASRFRR